MYIDTRDYLESQTFCLRSDLDFSRLHSSQNASASSKSQPKHSQRNKEKVTVPTLAKAGRTIP